MAASSSTSSPNKNDSFPQSLAATDDGRFKGHFQLFTRFFLLTSSFGTPWQGKESLLIQRFKYLFAS